MEMIQGNSNVCCVKVHVIRNQLIFRKIVERIYLLFQQAQERERERVEKKSFQLCRVIFAFNFACKCKSLFWQLFKKKLTQLITFVYSFALICSLQALRHYLSHTQLLSAYS